MRSAFSILLMTMLLVAGFSNSRDRKILAEDVSPTATSLQMLAPDYTALREVMDIARHNIAKIAPEPNFPLPLPAYNIKKILSELQVGNKLSGFALDLKYANPAFSAFFRESTSVEQFEGMVKACEALAKSKFDEIYKIVKNADNTPKITPILDDLSETLKDVIKNYGFEAKENAASFLNDLTSNASFREFLEVAEENGIKAWEGLINIKNLRTNIDWLTRSSKWIDEGAEFVTTNGITKLRKGADDILEIKNEKILCCRKF